MTGGRPIDGQAQDLPELVERGYRFALALTHDPDAAMDVLQDAWSSVLYARGPWNCSYLFAAVRSRFLDRVSNERALHPEPLDEHAAGIEAKDEAPPLPISLNGQLESALASLSPVQRAVLYLSTVEGFSAAEIAELLKWPRGTVLSTMHRAKLALRVKLAQPE